jgi:hypothetical protein
MEYACSHAYTPGFTDPLRTWLAGRRREIRTPHASEFRMQYNKTGGTDMRQTPSLNVKLLLTRSAILQLTLSPC